MSCSGPHECIYVVQLSIVRVLLHNFSVLYSVLFFLHVHYGNAMYMCRFCISVLVSQESVLECNTRLQLASSCTVG